MGVFILANKFPIIDKSDALESGTDILNAGLPCAKFYRCARIAIGIGEAVNLFAIGFVIGLRICTKFRVEAA